MVRRLGTIGFIMGLFLVAGGQPEDRPRSVAVSPGAITTVVTIPDEQADSEITVVVDRDNCVVTPPVTQGPDVRIVVDNRDRLDAVVTVGFAQTPPTSAGSVARFTLPLRTGRLELKCGLAPALGTTPVDQATTVLEVT